jgi:hypothetical protein
MAPVAAPAEVYLAANSWAAQEDSISKEENLRDFFAIGVMR